MMTQWPGAPFLSKDDEIITSDEPILGRSIQILSPLIASCIFRWGALEKQLDLVFGLVSNADKDLKAGYDGQFGWERKFKAILAASATTISIQDQDVLRAVLNLTRLPAAKRDLLAHGVWATSPTRPNYLVLVEPSAQGWIAAAVVEAGRSGRSDSEICNNKLLQRSQFIGHTDLQTLLREMSEARARLDALIWGYLAPSVVHVDGDASRNQYKADLDRDDALISMLQQVRTSRSKHEKSLRRALAPNSDKNAGAEKR